MSQNVVLAKICRKIARNIAEHKNKEKLITVALVHKYLGPEKVSETLAEKKMKLA